MSRLPVVAVCGVSLVVTVSSFVAFSCSAFSSDDSQPNSMTVPPPGSVSIALAIPQNKSYSGAYIDFGPREDNVTRQALEKYDKLVGKKQAIIGFSSDWGNQSFPAGQMEVIRRYGAVPLVYWSPWDRPLGAPQARNRFHLQKILDGDWDKYIDMWAARALEYRYPMMVAWGLEMNGQWFPWSGYFYGAGTPVPGTSPQLHEGPEMFKKTYRYVADRVKRSGAANISWVFHVNNTSDPAQPWNAMANYYPGDEYVDWLGMSAYGKQYPDQLWPVFDLVIPQPCAVLEKIHPDKPIILAEWGIGEFPDSGSKAAWLEEAFRRIPRDCPRVRGAVFWHELWENGDKSVSNLYVDSSPAALAAFKKGISDVFWLERPLLTGR